MKKMTLLVFIVAIILFGSIMGINQFQRNPIEYFFFVNDKAYICDLNNFSVRTMSTSEFAFDYSRTIVWKNELDECISMVTPTEYIVLFTISELEDSTGCNEIADIIMTNNEQVIFLAKKSSEDHFQMYEFVADSFSNVSDALFYRGLSYNDSGGILCSLWDGTDYNVSILGLDEFDLRIICKGRFGSWLDEGTSFLYTPLEFGGINVQNENLGTSYTYPVSGYNGINKYNLGDNEFEQLSKDVKIYSCMHYYEAKQYVLVSYLDLAGPGSEDVTGLYYLDRDKRVGLVKKFRPHLNGLSTKQIISGSWL